MEPIGGRQPYLINWPIERITVDPKTITSGTSRDSGQSLNKNLEARRPHYAPPPPTAAVEPTPIRLPEQTSARRPKQLTSGAQRHYRKKHFPNKRSQPTALGRVGTVEQDASGYAARGGLPGCAVQGELFCLGGGGGGGGGRVGRAARGGIEDDNGIAGYDGWGSNDIRN